MQNTDTTKDLASKVLPCPFCGRHPEIQPWHGGKPTKVMISCTSEIYGECVHPHTTGETLELVTAVWNTRAHLESATCQHENRKRGGAIWTICEDCGMKWADDDGGCPLDKSHLESGAEGMKAAEDITPWVPDWAKGHFVIAKDWFSEGGLKTFEEFMRLVHHGAKFIDICVRKDGKNYHFQCDALKHIESDALRAATKSQDAPEPLANGHVSRLEHGNLPSAFGIPNNWQLVPKEPTHEMFEAGYSDNDGDRLLDPRGCYKAMLAAAPQAQTQEWLPIESAPKTDKDFFLIVSANPDDHRHAFPVRGDILVSARKENCPKHLSLHHITHWMPLPADPVSKEG